MNLAGMVLPLTALRLPLSASALSAFRPGYRGPSRDIGTRRHQRDARKPAAQGGGGGSFPPSTSCACASTGTGTPCVPYPGYTEGSAAQCGTLNITQSCAPDPDVTLYQEVTVTATLSGVISGTWYKLDFYHTGSLGGDYVNSVYGQLWSNGDTVDNVVAVGSLDGEQFTFDHCEICETTGLGGSCI